jgi:hypothetical protein
MSQKELMLEYSKLYQQKKEIENQLAELKEQIDVPEEKVVNDYGTFYSTSRTTWTYSGDVKALEGDLKNLKKKEEKSGKAKSEVKVSLAFKLNS